MEARLGRCGGRVPRRGLIERAGEPGIEYGRVAGAQLGMRGEHAGIVMSVTPRPGHQRGEPVEQLERGEGELGLAGGQRLGEAIANGLIRAVPGESFTGEGGTGAVAQQPAADPPLHGAEGGRIEIRGGVELQRAGRLKAEHPVGNAAVQVSVGVERGAEGFAPNCFDIAPKYADVICGISNTFAAPFVLTAAVSLFGAACYLVSGSCRRQID